MARQEEKRKAREERAAAKAAGVDVDSEQYSSAGGQGGQSEKSGSKRSKPTAVMDQRSAQSPNIDDKSKTASEMQSIGKGHQSSEEEPDEDMDDDNDDDGMDEITNLNQQHELRRELIATIEEALRE